MFQFSITLWHFLKLEGVLQKIRWKSNELIDDIEYRVQILFNVITIMIT